MPAPRFRIRTLMYAVAVVALYAAGLVCGPVWMVIALVLFALLAPIALVIVYLVCKVGRNTLV